MSSPLGLAIGIVVFFVVLIILLLRDVHPAPAVVVSLFLSLLFSGPFFGNSD